MIQFPALEQEDPDHRIESPRPAELERMDSAETTTESLLGEFSYKFAPVTVASKYSKGISPVNCVDLFAGAGGFSFAAAEIGLNVVAAVELDTHACTTYRHNISGTSLYETDILDLSPSILLNNHFSDGSTCDLILGGPPCQGFSVHRIKGAGIADPRNQLVLRYFEFVERLRPKAFLMENVPGLLWERHKAFLDAFYEQGSRSGYRIQPPVVLDARDYGVPQRRKRVFVLGIRKGVEFRSDWPPPRTHGSQRACSNNPNLLPWRTAAVVFKELLAPGDENNLHMNHSAELIEVFKSTPLNGGSRRESNRVLGCHKGHDGHSDVYGRIDPNEPGPTMTTACINPSKGRFVHPTEHHGITLRHAARFQEFPDSFVFKGGLMAAGAQIGNAVPIRLGKVLLQAVADGLLPRTSDPVHG